MNAHRGGKTLLMAKTLADTIALHPRATVGIACGTLDQGRALERLAVALLDGTRIAVCDTPTGFVASNGARCWFCLP